MSKVTVQRSGPAKSPTEQIVAEANEEVTITDEKGREIVMRRLNDIEQVRWVRFFGGENESFQGIAGLVSLVRRVDEVDFTGIPMEAEHVERRYAVLGAVGMKAVTAQAQKWTEAQQAQMDQAALKK